MFGFGRSTKDPLSDVRAAERWLSTLPGGDSLAVHSGVIEHLERAAGQTALRTPHRLRAVFHVDAQTETQRRALIGQYIEHASRSSKIENQLWTALFGLTQGFLRTYQSFAREISDHPQTRRWQELLPRSFVDRSCILPSMRAYACSATSSGFLRSGRSCMR